MATPKKVRPEKSVKTQPAVPSVARAVAKYLRIAPRKLRLVIDAVRHKPTSAAFVILTGLKRKGARLAEQVLKSAVANAKVLGMDESKLYVSDIRADGGPMMKRFLSRSMGRADRILKRMSHLSVTVKESQKMVNQDAAGTTAQAKQEGGSAKPEAKKKASRTKAAAKAAKA